MKTYHEPIQVDLGADGAPRSWRWRRRVWHVLRVLDRWVLQSRWWTGHGERRDYLLVEAALVHGAPTGSPATAAGATVAPDPAPDSPEACAVEIYRRRPGCPDGTGPGHDAWILARILS